MVATKLSIELLKAPAVYFSGDTIQGVVIVESPTVITTRSIVIVLEGVEVVPRPPDYNYHVTTSLLKKTKTLFGEKWDKLKDALILQLAPGSHRFPFSFKLPEILHPSRSHKLLHSYELSISYNLEAFVDAPNTLTNSMMMSDSYESVKKPVIVGGHSFTPETIKFESKKTETNSATKSFFAQRGQLSFSAFLESKVAISQRTEMTKVASKAIVLTLTIQNESKKTVEGIFVKLVQQMKTFGVEIEREVVHKFPVKLLYHPPSPQPKIMKLEFDLPNNITPTTDSKHLNVTYFLQIELVVGSLFASNLTTTVPLTILGPDEKISELLLPRSRINKKKAQGSASLKPPVSLVESERHDAKVWMPDTAASQCCVCFVEFNSLTIRRHHCRSCGRVVCAKCSPKAQLTELGSVPQRVCNYCVAQAAKIPKITTEEDGFVLMVA